MPKTDLEYMISLADAIRSGDMNAFAEFYSATCGRQYNFAMDLLQDEFDARTVLEETYIHLLNTIGVLRDNSLIVVYLTHTTFKLCLKKRNMLHEKDPFSEVTEIDGVQYSLNRVFSLPYTESSSIILVYYCRYRISQTAQILELSRTAVRHYIANGVERLAAASDGGDRGDGLK